MSNIKVPDPVKQVVKKVRQGSFHLYDDADLGWMLDTGSGNPFPASPFEVLLWNELVQLREENVNLKDAVRKLNRSQKTMLK